MKLSHNERYRQIAQKIVYYRMRKGFSQDELADKIGISKSYLSKIEAPNSTKAFSLDVLFTIADGLNVDVAHFFSSEDNNEALSPDSSNNKDKP